MTLPNLTELSASIRLGAKAENILGFSEINDSASLFV